MKNLQIKMAAKVMISVLVVLAISAAYGMNIEIPKECENKAYCNKRPNFYPEKLFNDHIREKEKLLVRNRRYQDEPKVQIYNSDEYNCHTKVSIIQPFIVRSNATMKLVVQTNIFEQWVKQTECLNTGAPCFKDILKPSYTSSCSSTDGTIKLYLYDPIKKRFEHEGVTFPVCCSCSIKSSI